MGLAGGLVWFGCFSPLFVGVVWSLRRPSAVCFLGVVVLASAAAAALHQCAVYLGAVHFTKLSQTEVVSLRKKRSLLWSSVGGSPCRALHAWLVSHGWVLRRPWIWHHDLTGHFLDLSVAGDAGASQHIVRDAWRAWCLQRHNASSRRDAALDCFGDTGYFRSIDWEATRKFAASCPEARTICTGGCNSPAALGGRLAGVMRILQPQTESGPRNYFFIFFHFFPVSYHSPIM